MIRKVIQILIWLCVFAYMAMALAFTERMEDNQKVSYIKVELMDSTESQFVDREDVIKVLRQHGFKITGMPLDSINRSGIQEAVFDIPEVKSAEVYYTPDGNLNIRIWQRKPVVRIKSGNLDFFLDEENMPLPFSSRFTPKVLIVTGKVNARNARDKIFDLAVYIQKDPFFGSLIQELHVDSNQKIEIIPRIGNQRIFMGESDDFELKLAKLKVFYEKALPNLGWEKYSSIDLRFRDQVVCKKKELSSLN